MDSNSDRNFKSVGEEPEDRKRVSFEIWFYENPERIASVLRGIEDIEAGRLVKLELSADDAE